MASRSWLPTLLVICLQLHIAHLDDLGDDLDGDDLDSGGDIEELEEKPLAKCPPIIPPPHAMLTTNSTANMGSFVMVKCSPGYEKTGGDEKHVCTPTLTYAGKPIQCKAIKCYSLVVPNASANTTERTFSTVVRLHCTNGTLPELGDTVRTCLANKRWSGDELICKRPECPPLRVPYGVTLSTSTRVVGTKVKLGCSKGLWMKGNKKVSVVHVCGKDKKWKGKLVKCVEAKCPKPKTMRHATRSTSRRRIGTIVSYVCAKGYYLTGKKPITYAICRGTGKWSKTKMTCRIKKAKAKKKKKKHSKHRKYCHAFKRLSGTSYRRRSRRPGYTTKYICMPGYGPPKSGSKEIKCMKNLRFSAAPLTCTAGQNIAVGKPAFQSSTFPQFRLSAGNAVDGDNILRSIYSGSCVSTSGKDKPWWAVDLQIEYPVMYVNVYATDAWNKMRKYTTNHMTYSVTNRRPGKGEFKTKESETCTHRKSYIYPDKISYRKCPTILTGRFVVLSKNSVSLLNFCEVEVIPKASITASRTAFQSSTFGNYTAKLAIDQNNNRKLSAHSCSMTNIEKNPWWAVDLQKSTSIESVTLFYKSDISATEILANFSVSTSDTKPKGHHFTPKPKDVCYSQKEPLAPGESKGIVCTPRRGRFVVVSMKGVGSLSLCEVLVYSKLVK